MVEKTSLYHLVGREPANPQHPNLRTFSLQFAWLSPYVAANILDLTEAQEVRFFAAYDLAKGLLKELGIFPDKTDSLDDQRKQERLAMEIDEFERGYPRLKLGHLMDVVTACSWAVDRSDKDSGSRKKKGEG